MERVPTPPSTTKNKSKSNTPHTTQQLRYKNRRDRPRLRLSLLLSWQWASRSQDAISTGHREKVNQIFPPLNVRDQTETQAPLGKALSNLGQGVVGGD